MSPSRFEIVTVPAGVRSLRSLEHGETFHPGVGPMAEADFLHVAQHGLPSRVAGSSRAFIIWDVGLGAGANAVAVLQAARHAFPLSPVELHSFDCTLEPFRFALAHAAELQYPLPWLESLDAISRGGPVTLGALTWHLHLGDFREPALLASAPPPQAVIFDPYSPAANPGMWTAEVFGAIRTRVESACTLSTYSRSTVTRANLLRAGWFVGRGVATGEKTETTVAASELAILRDPLRADWLERLRRSTAAALRGEGGALASELARHRQFAS